MHIKFIKSPYKMQIKITNNIYQNQLIDSHKILSGKFFLVFCSKIINLLYKQPKIIMYKNKNQKFY